MVHAIKNYSALLALKALATMAVKDTVNTWYGWYLCTSLSCTLPVGVFVMMICVASFCI